jgi:DNA-binding protein H-NS
MKSCENTMSVRKLETMDFEELWALHEELTKVLAEKITAEKIALDRRLALLNRTIGGDEIGGETKDADPNSARAYKYPKVPAKYRNPAPPFETWSGRGKRPRWLADALQRGHVVEDFRIKDRDEKPSEN